MYGQGFNQTDHAMTGNQPDANGFYVNPNGQAPRGPPRPHGQLNQQAQYRPQQQQQQGMHMQQQQPQQQSYPAMGASKMDDPYASYAPQTMSPTNSQTPAQNGFFDSSSYAHDPMQQQMPPPPQQSQYYSNQHYPNTGNATPPQTRLSNSYASNYNPSMSPQASPATSQLPGPPLSHQDFTPMASTSQRQQQSRGHQQSTFYEMPQQQQYQPQQQPQQQQQQQQQQQPQQPQMPNMQSAVPFMLAGMQQMANGAPGTGFNAALGAQLFQSLAPGAVGYTNQFFGQGQDNGKTFMRMPKYYFAVNHRYVLKKLAIIIMPFTHRIWARQRGMDPGHFEGSISDGGVPTYLPPRDDVNAPDLYIPLMSFMTYVLMVGFVFGIRDDFHAEVLARYFSKGLGVLSLEVLIIKLGLYLVNARPTPWLDIIAYRGYKFVGVVLAMASWLLMPRLYLPVLFYAATAMVVFLMRSHRRIILPRDVDLQQATDLARRNGFLLFLSVLQYPIYWILVLGPRR